MNNICIIPARGGSKRILRKNIKHFLGKPIIAYSIETALNSGLFKEVMVSTDDEHIAAIAREHGAKVPFMRSAENSDDYATTKDVIIEVLQSYQQLEIFFDRVCCLYPTAPFVSISTLKESLSLLKTEKYDTVFPISPFGAPIQRALKVENGKVMMFQPENKNKRSQDLTPAYHDAGQFYWLDIPTFLQDREIFSSNSGAIVLEEIQVQDIDTPVDWQIAELKYRLLNDLS